MFNYEGNFVGADFEDGPSPFAPRIRVAETGVEETRVVDSEFSDECVISDHLCRVRRRDFYGFS